MAFVWGVYTKPPNEVSMLMGTDKREDTAEGDDEEASEDALAKEQATRERERTRSNISIMMAYNDNSPIGLFPWAIGNEDKINFAVGGKTKKKTKQTKTKKTFQSESDDAGARGR